VTEAARRLSFHARDGLLLSAVDHPGPQARTPILCLPGLTRSAGDFDHLAERHAPMRRVLVLEYAGHGESGRPEAISRYGIPHSLGDVLDAMAALHCPRAVIVGTSFGGLLAMVLGVMRPSAIAGVVLNDIGPKMEGVGLDLVQSFVGHDPALRSFEETVAHLRSTLPPLLLDEAGWKRHAERVYAPGPDRLWHPRWDVRIAEALRSNGPAPELWDAFGALSHAPLMLVRGELSHLLSAATALRMRQMRPDMQFINVPGSGHAPTLEEAQVVPALDRFLNAIP
jgi:pimeloyl-ACP methyl ester carboxylesterase